MRVLFLSLVLLMISQVSYSQINWLSWEEAQELMKKEPRKVFVDVYTEWCGWCKKMDKTTFQNPKIIKYLNDNYYAIKFDAEVNRTIQVAGRDYNYISTGRKGYNELAAHILRGKMSYPSLVFMDSEMNVIQPIPGFQDVKTLNMILHYFNGNHHKSIPWRQYVSEFKRRKKQENIPVQHNINYQEAKNNNP